MCDCTIDTSLAHLKTTMQMDVLHGQMVSGVLKELTVFAIVYSLVRMVMWHSACPRTDQLGHPRAGLCDIGAIEFQGKHRQQH